MGETITHIAKDATHELERTFHGIRCLVHILIAHPERPFGGRNFHFCIRESERAIGTAQARNMVAMEMGDDHHIDLFGINASGCHIGQQITDFALGITFAIAGIDKHEFSARVDQHRIVRHRHARQRHGGSFERLADFFLGDIAHESVRHGEGPRAVGDDGHFHIADLVAIDASGLFSDNRGRCKSGLSGKGSAGSQCANRATARDLCHGQFLHKIFGTQGLRLSSAVGLRLEEKARRFCARSQALA